MVMEECNVEYLYDEDELFYLLLSVLKKHIPNDTKRIVVPISGGLDSRLLLLCLLNIFKKEQIVTMGYGCTGQLDYEIGKSVAKELGLEHMAIDLSDIKLNWEDLLLSAKRAPWTYMPDELFNRKALEKVVSNGDIIVSGFLGDALTGGHYISKKSKWDVEKSFINSQKKKYNSVLQVPFFEPSISPSINTLDHQKYASLLDICIRQSNCISKILSGDNPKSVWAVNRGKINQANIIAPFLDAQWCNYWFNCPESLLKEQILYENMIRKKFPEIVKLPYKKNYGEQPNTFHYYRAKYSYRFAMLLSKILPKVFQGSPMMHNYVNYGHLFRAREDYKAVFTHASNILKRDGRFDHINIDLIWKNHLNYKADNTQEMLTIIGVAANLVANGD